MKKIILTLFVCFGTLFGEDVYAVFDVEAFKKATLSLDATGIVGEVKVDVGSRVNESDILLELNNNEEKLSVELSKIALEKTSLAYEQSKKTFERYASLKDLIDKEQYEKYELDKNQKEQDFLNAKRSLELAQVRLEKTVLKAPFSGVVSAKYLEKGDSMVGMQATKAFEIVDFDRAKLVVSFDEKYWKKVKKGTVFKYKVDGDNKEYTGEISKIYPTIDPKTRKVKAEVLVKNLTPGLFGDGYLILGK